MPRVWDRLYETGFECGLDDCAASSVLDSFVTGLSADGIAMDSEHHGLQGRYTRARSCVPPVIVALAVLIATASLAATQLAVAHDWTVSRSRIWISHDVHISVCQLGTVQHRFRKSATAASHCSFVQVGWLVLSSAAAAGVARPFSSEFVHTAQAL